MNKKSAQADKRLCQTPLEELWNDEGILKAHRVRYVTTEQIKLLLRQEAVIFILATAGHKLQWYDSEQAFTFWQEVRNHICD